MNTCNVGKFLSYALIVACSMRTVAGYNTVRNSADFDKQIARHSYVVVAFYHEDNEGKGQMADVEIEQLKQFRVIFKQVSNSAKYKNKGVRFIAVNVAPGSDGARIKQRYEVTGYPSYIIIHNGRQVSPAPFSFFKIGEGYLSDAVSRKQLEDFIDQVIK